MEFSAALSACYRMENICTDVGPVKVKSARNKTPKVEAHMVTMPLE